jgi:hypothetical protein
MTCRHDVSTLYFEVLRDRCRRRVPRTWFSKERRLDPQITIGLLTDAAGFPLMVNAFVGNTAETTTRDDHDAADDPGVMQAHQLPDVTIVADPRMNDNPAANQQAIEAADVCRRRVVVHPRGPYPRGPLPGRGVAAGVAAGPSRAGDS